MKLVLCYSNTIFGSCGVGTFTEFSSCLQYGRRLDAVETEGGCGFLLAGFIDTSICRQAYEILAKRFKVVYQSPVRRNTNSGNRFFFVIYDTKEN